MLTKKELGSTILAIIILGFVVSLSNENFNKVILSSLFSIALIFFINILFKKIAAFYLDTEIELQLWEGERYGITPGAKFKKPFQWGIILPILVKILSLGYLNWSAIMTFETKGKTYRAAKRHGIYSFSEVTEFQIGLIAAIGLIGSLLGAFVGYLFGFEHFARLSVGFAFFNIIPLSNLDGNKIFFGNTVLWAFLAALSSLGTLLAILTI